MSTISLKIMRSAAEGGGARSPGPPRPLFRGNGATDYVCGQCGSVMAAAMGPAERVIVDTAVCPACGAENEFPPDLRA